MYFSATQESVFQVTQLISMNFHEWNFNIYDNVTLQRNTIALSQK